MKELSIEEKAKAYDKAVERAIAWRKKYINFTLSEDGTMIQEFDNIFHQLKESEDEKIRTGAITSIKRFIEYTEEEDCAPDIKDMLIKNAEKQIAWLEKQGKQTLANTAKTCKEEQNPAWSEEDEIRLKHTLSLLDVKDDDKYLLMFGLNSLQDLKKDTAWLKALKERVQLQPKQEWSEEDEKFFKTALWHISYSVSNGKNTDVHCDTTDWLKALKERYTWKPSKEQIEALKYCLGEGGTYNKEAIMSLLTDLSGL